MTRWNARPVLILLLVVFASLSMVSAQGFIEPIEQSALRGKEAILTTADGVEHPGHIANMLLVMGKLKSMSWKNDDGTKTKYKVDEIQSVQVKMGKLMKFALFASGDSVWDFANRDYEEIANREYINFELALMPSKPGKKKYQLMQLVNPGFDQRIKVYQPPSSGGGLSGLTGSSGPDYQYVAVKDGESSFKIKEDKYKKKHFEELFGDCDLMTTTYSTKKGRKWRYFAEHVFVYGSECER